MRIKEVEQRTGLTAKAIRLYESKGLLSVARQTENDYRDYTEEDVARLKTIAILRKLDVPVKIIKEWTDGKTTLHDILQKAAQQNREASRESELRHKLATDLAELLEENPEADLGEAVEVLEELDEILEELAALTEEEMKHVGIPLFSTLLALGPIGFTVIYIQEGMPEKALFALVLAILDVAWVTLRWRDYFSVPKAERRHDGCLSAVLLGVVLLVAAFGLMIWIQNIQIDLFYHKDTDVALYRAELLPLVIIVELTAGAFWLKEKPWQEKRWKIQTVAIAAAVLLVVNAVIVYISVMSVSIANEQGITRYSVLCPEGVLTSYTEITQIDTGFKGMTLGLPIRDTGEFYYEITYADGRTEDWGKAICHEEEISWSFIIWFDEWVRSGGAEKHGTDKNWEYCEMEQFYVDILRQAINSR